ncbi:glycosyl transferase 4 family protein [Massilia sp. NEAU-DD11]|uniref:Glycosyl transferase 4 family protein n=1 Tax=Massilia cellulosiltytica TaxID=2683234 RepID=A0A7X3G3P4_9BURK|nr:glycosyltransferase [Telluria cellulosilytica]MVW63053.1 glycosyl transferase 4 family protein [Telluria cellulosilytica]
MPEYKFVLLGLTAWVASFVISQLIVRSQKWHGRLTHDHDLGGVQKVHTTAVPRIGGLAVIGGILLGFVLFQQIFPGHVSASRASRIYLLLGASLPAFLAGLIEDFTKRVSVRVRLVATALSALVASLALGATVGELDIWGLDALLTIAPLAIVATAVFVAGGSNAINIIDGFNGLSGSTIIIMAIGLAAVGLQVGDSFVAVLGALCAGATLGFLMLNYPSGKMFLGDGGAYFLGFWVSEMAVLLLVRHPELSAWQILAICGYPIIEVLFSIYRRKFVRKVSPGAPDALHLHGLVFRRLVFKYVRRDTARPWKRNAMVPCFMAPAVAACVAVSVWFGQSTPAAVAIVVAQVVLYIAVYGRLVRGRWTVRRANRAEQALDVGIEVR